MSRLFTHHDRLYLYSSPTSGDADPLPTGADQPKPDQETDEEPAPHPKEGGFAVFIPHFHKAFGLLALLNMLLYQTPYYHQILRYFGQDRMVRFAFIHVVLAFSSFEFRIGRARNSLYTIYREMQLHTIIFTMRSWTAIMCAWYFNITNIVSRSILILFWHVAADLATQFFKPPSKETTIRRSVDGEMGYKGYGTAAHWGLWFFSFAQLVGTYMLLTDTPDVVRDAMFVMTPVQLSAFLATLVRKGYFTSHVSITIYFMILWPIFLYHHWTLLDVTCVTLANFLRFHVKLNKYVMWVSIALAVAYLHGDLKQFVASWSPELASQVPPPPMLPSWYAVQTAQPYTVMGNWLKAMF